MTFKSTINHAGKTSMEVGIRVEAEDRRTGLRRHTNSCYFTMVALDDERNPVPIPSLLIDGEEERQRYMAAVRRRDQRKANASRTSQE